MYPFSQKELFSTQALWEPNASLGVQLLQFRIVVSAKAPTPQSIGDTQALPSIEEKLDAGQESQAREV